MSQLSELWKKLREFQCETESDNKEAIAEELREYIELHASIIFPSFIYPFLFKVFAEYPSECAEDLEAVLPCLEKQEDISKTLEAEFRSVLCRVKSGRFKTVNDIAAALYGVIYPQAQNKSPFKEISPYQILENQYRLLKTLFSTKQAISFFTALFRRMPSEWLKEFACMEDVFWDQLSALRPLKAVLVETRTREARFVRLDIEISPLLEGSKDKVVFENTVDQRMENSCSRAVKIARAFLEGQFPDVVKNRFFRVVCRFQNPLAEYQDTSASLLVGVRMVGILLDREIQPHIIVSGEVDDSGRVLPVKHIPEKIRIAEHSPDIHQILLPKNGFSGTDSQTNQALKIITARTFDEAIQQYYGQQQLRALRHQDDWGDAPDVPIFWGRTEELHTLKQWIIQDRCRLIAIVGLRGIGKTGLSVQFRKGGIGKTDLSLKLAHNIQSEFDFVIWRSLRDAPPLDYILADLIKFLSKQHDTLCQGTLDEQLSQVISYLHTHRCLIILDNVETILHGSELQVEMPEKHDSMSYAGQCREGYAGYGQLFEKIGEIPHNSCLLLTSRERPYEVNRLAGANRPVRLLELEGLDEAAMRALFMELGSFSGGDDDWKALLDLYHGNPLAFELVAKRISEDFKGNIAQFLQREKPDVNNLYDLLDWHFERLSEQEKEVMYWLTIHREPTTEIELEEDLVSMESKQAVSRTLGALEQRLPITHTETGMTLQPVLIEYITRRFIQQIGEEILTGEIKLLNSHTLIKALAKDYIRESQIRLILREVLSWSPVHLEEELTHILSTLRQTSSRQPGHYIERPVRQLLPSLQKKLSAVLNSQESLEAQLTRILSTLRKTSARKPGYASGNIFNLLSSLKNHKMQGYDFSHLTVWQAYLKGGDFRDINFAGSDLNTSVFSEIFGTIFSVAFSPDGKLLAAGTSEAEIQVWQVSNWKLLFTCRGHAYWVMSLTFSPDGSMLASGSDDETVRLWDVYTGRCLKILQGHTHGVQSVAFNSDGKLLGSGSEDHTLKLWDVHTGQCLKTLRGHTGRLGAVAFSPYDKIIASGAEDHIIKLWNIDSGQCFKTLGGHSHRIRAVAFGLDGGTLVSGSEDRTVKLWDVRSGRCLRTLQAHDSEVTSIALTPDGSTLVSSSLDQTIKIWNLNTAQHLETLQKHTGSVWSVSLSPDGNLLASGGEDQTVKLWDIKSGRCLKTLQGRISSIFSVAFDRNGSILASGGEHTVSVWDIHTGKCLKTLPGHISWIWTLAFSVDGRILASGSKDQTIRLWNVDTGQCLNTLRGHTNWIRSVALSPDNRILASSSDDRTVRLWDIASGQPVNMLEWSEPQTTNRVYSLTFSPINSVLAGSGDRVIKLWDIHTGQCLQALRGHNNGVWSLSFSPDGRILASGSDDNTIKLWDVRTGQCLRTLQGTAWIRTVAFIADGRILASGSDDGAIKLWNVHSGQCLRTLSPDDRLVVGGAGTSVRQATAFSPHGWLVASGTHHGTIEIQNMQSGEYLQALQSTRPYEQMNITGATGLTEAQKANLKALGAIEKTDYE